MSDQPPPCPYESRLVALGFDFQWCPEHESGRLQGVHFDSDGVAMEEILEANLAVLENTIAASLLGKDGPVREYALREHPGGQFDRTEAMRFANMVANQVLVRAVMKRSYAKVAQFHAPPEEG